MLLNPWSRMPRSIGDIIQSILSLTIFKPKEFFT